MNGRIAKKIRKGTKRNWKEYLKEVRDLPFWIRFRLARWIIYGDKRKV